MAGWGSDACFWSLSPLEGRKGKKDVFLMKTTYNAVTSTLKRSTHNPLQESCVLLLFGPEVLHAPGYRATRQKGRNT